MVTERVVIVVDQRGARRASGAIRKVGSSSRSSAASVKLLTGALAALGGALSVRQFIRLADASIELNRRIGFTTDSVEKFAAVNERLDQISTRTRTGLSENAALFQRLRIATRDLGVSTADVLDVVEGLNAAVAVGGSSAVEAAAGITQLGQALASGRLSGDELRSVLEGLPALAQRLADELGVGIGKLREMGEAGELTGQVVFPALQRAVAKFSEELDGVQFTTEQTFKLLENSALRAVGDINGVVNSSGILNEGILTLAGSLRGFLIIGFAELANITAEVLLGLDSIGDTADDLGIKVLPTLGQSLGLVSKSFILLIQSATTGIQAIRTGANAVGLALRVISFGLGGRTGEEVEEQLLAFNEAQGDLLDSVDRTNATLDSFDKAFADIAKGGLLTGSDAAEKFAAKLLELRKELLATLNASKDIDFSSLDDETESTITDPVDDKAIAKADKDRRKALQDLLTISTELRLEEIGRISELERELSLIDAQIAQALELGRLADDEVFAAKVVNDLIAERARLIEDENREERAAALQDLLSISRDLRIEELGRESVLDAEIALLDEQIAQAVALAKLAGDEIFAQKVVNDLIAERKRILEEASLSSRIAESLSADIAGGLSAGFAEAVRQGTPILESFAESFEVQAEESLIAAFDSGFKALEEGLDAVFTKVGTLIGDQLGPAFEGVSEGFGEALSSVIGFLVNTGLAALFGGGTGQTSQAAGVRSAVTSTEAVRGIVAGPQNIAIANVGNAIQDGFVPVVDILTIIASLTSEIRDNTAGASSAGATGGSLASVSAFQSGSTQ